MSSFQTTQPNKIVLIEYLHEVILIIHLAVNLSNHLSNLLQHAMLKSFLAGSFSASCSTLLFQPFDLLKTRIQSAHLLTTSTVSPSLPAQSAATNRMLPLIFDVIKNEQLFGLWRGTVPVSFNILFCCLMS